MTDTLESLRDRIGVLEQRIAELTKPTELIFPRWMKLPPMANRLLAFMVLRAPEWVTRDQCMAAIYDDPWADTAPEEKIIDVTLAKLRPVLRRNGIHIETAWGLGWRLTLEHVRILERLIVEDIGR